MKKLGEVEGKPIFLEGLSVFSEDNEYLFSFITIGTGIHLGNKRVPIDILKKASQILEKDTASLSRA